MTRFVALLLSLVLLAACGDKGPDTPGGAPEVAVDRLFTNAVVWTGIDGAPDASVLGVRDGVIVYVGDGEDIDFKVAADKVRNVEGRFLMPGFIDNHVHFFWGGAGLASVRLRDAGTPEEFSARIVDFAATVPEGRHLRREVPVREIARDHFFLDHHGQHQLGRGLREVAQRFGIQQWPVAAVKAYLGHSIGCAGGDQLTATLGSWQHGLLPGIATIDHVAEDVHASHLAISPQHRELDLERAAYAIINAKGKGAKDRVAPIGSKAVSSKESLAGRTQPIYKFDHQVLQAGDVQLEGDRLRLGDAAEVSLALDNPYADMC